MKKIASILTICLLTSFMLAKTATAGNVQSYPISLDNLKTTNSALCANNNTFVSGYSLSNSSCTKLQYKCNSTTIDSFIAKKIRNDSISLYNKYCLNQSNAMNAQAIQKSIEQPSCAVSKEATTSTSKPAEQSTGNAPVSKDTTIITSKPADQSTGNVTKNTETTTSTKSTTTATESATVAAKPANSPGSVDASSAYREFQQKVIELVNKERAAAGLNALTENGALDQVATLKSQDMVDLNYFSHTSPTYGSPFQMLTQFNISYTYAGENIAYGQTTPEQVMNGWMNSPGHRANILNTNFTQIGVGIAKKANGQLVWTQTFLRP